MILLSHPTGNNVSRAVLSGLQREGLLAQFVTSVAFCEPARLGWLPAKVRRECLRRRFDLPSTKVRTRPWRELGRMAAARVGAQFLTRHETSPLSVDSVYRDVDQFVGRNLEKAARQWFLSGVYCYEDGACDTFRAASGLGLRKIYDLPIAYWETSQRLLREEAERLPEWAVTMPGTADSSRKLQRKAAELEMADVVLCPSSFVFNSLPAWCRERKQCVTAEFGSPPSPPQLLAPRRTLDRPLRVLFAGSMTQRKGLADVFAAMKLLKRQDVELVVLGSPVAPMDFYRRQYPHFIHKAPRPNAAVLELMATCDVLVLPSIVEGRAVVQQEAMSRGLPLIITPNTGGEDLVDEGRTGFLVPIRAPERIAEKIDWLASHREELGEMQVLARRKAGELTWEGYARKVVEAVQNSGAAELLTA